MGKLRNAKADRRETERERKMLDAITHMKQLFPGARTVPASPPYLIPPTHTYENDKLGVIMEA